MVVLVVMVQVALWAHANSVAQAAAEHGAEVASAFRATEAEGEQAAEGFLANASHMSNVDVDVQRSAAGVVTVQVRAESPGVFGPLAINATTSLVVERVGPP